MSTHAHTIVWDDGVPLVGIYTHDDGDMAHHGAALKRLTDDGHIIITKEVSADPAQNELGTIAQGMECLAAQLVAGLKTRVGGTYLFQGTDGLEIDCLTYPEAGVEAVYVYQLYMKGTNVAGALWCQVEYQGEALFNGPLCDMPS